MLRDRIEPRRAGALFVGINPGMRSSAIGHHFAGYSNRFWKLLCRIAAGASSRSGRKTTTGCPSGASASRTSSRGPRRGWTRSSRRVRRGRAHPAPEDPPLQTVRRGPDRRDRVPRVCSARACRLPVRLGLQPSVSRARASFVLPNPSGRNANFSYAEMLAAFRELCERLLGTPSEPLNRRTVEPVNLCLPRQSDDELRAIYGQSYVRSVRSACGSADAPDAAVLRSVGRRRGGGFRVRQRRAARAGRAQGPRVCRRGLLRGVRARGGAPARRRRRPQRVVSLRGHRLVLRGAPEPVRCRVRARFSEHVYDDQFVPHLPRDPRIAQARRGRSTCTRRMRSTSWSG